MMFDKIHVRLMKDALKRIGVDTKEEFQGRPRKVMYWVAFKLDPFILNVAIYIMLFYIIDGVRVAKGFEVAVLTCFMIIIFEISSQSSRIAEINGEHEENEYDKLKRLEKEAKNTESSANQKAS
jgi:hypothetical protein